MALDLYYIIDADSAQVYGVARNSRDEAIKDAEDILASPSNANKDYMFYIACVTDVIESKYEQVITKTEASKATGIKSGGTKVLIGG